MKEATLHERRQETIVRKWENDMFSVDFVFDDVPSTWHMSKRGDMTLQEVIEVLDLDEDQLWFLEKIKEL